MAEAGRGNLILLVLLIIGRTDARRPLFGSGLLRRGD